VNDRRSRILMIIHSVWALALLFLVLWWGTLINDQSEEIARLETQLGVEEYRIESRLERTERMILGEGSFFIIVVLLTNGILLYFFIRDHRRSKSIQAFFASMTHELRTPLTSIRLQAETLKDIEDNPKHAPFVNRLLEDVERLEGQVQQTLELARIEGGGALTPIPIPILQFFQHKIQPMLDRTETQMQVNSKLKDATLIADPTALTMIFRNTFDNAIKYSVSKPAQIQIQGHVEGDHYILEIRHDNSQFKGDVSQLGSLYYRGQNSQGAGIGLFLISTLMNKMKGSVEFAVDPTFCTKLEFKIEDDHE
jgi:signal transduction histidine kinase